MDDQPVSTQDSLATTVMLIWIITGVILVSATYFLIPSPSPWPALNAAGLVAGIYLIALVFFIARKPLRLLVRITLFVLAFVTMGATAFTWFNAERYVKEQRKYIRERRELTVRGMIFNSASQYLLQTLRTNQENAWTRSKSLEEIFRLRNTKVKVGEALPTIGYFTSIKFYVETLKPDSIVLTAMDQATPGRNSEFINCTGKKGSVQERFTLTRKGMIHESQN